MNLFTKKFLKQIIPKYLIKKLTYFFYYNSFKCGYKSFNELKEISNKYDSDKILNRARSAFKISTSKSYLNDRDGEVILKKNINFKLLNIITSSFKNQNIQYCVVDYGGSLANFYRTNIWYLKKFNIKWIVIDNSKICQLGNKILKNKNIYFFEDLKKTKKFIKNYNLKTTLFFFGSSVQYLDNFEYILSRVKEFNCKKVIIERQPILRSKQTAYAIQKTPFWAGNFSYAVKLYNYNKLINLVLKYNFFLKDSFKSFGDPFKDGEYRTLIFKKNV